MVLECKYDVYIKVIVSGFNVDKRGELQECLQPYTQVLLNLCNKSANIVIVFFEHWSRFGGNATNLNENLL